MKPKEYVEKFNLLKTAYVPNEMVQYFLEEFAANVELLSQFGNFTFARFKVCVTQAKQKWDSICNKSTLRKEQFEKAWGYMYATTIVKLRDSLFGDYLQQKKEAYEKRKAENDFWHHYEERWSEEWFRSIFGVVRKLASRDSLSEDFESLGLSIDADLGQVKERYKELAFRNHPDKGGSDDGFIKATMAKNRIIALLEREKTKQEA